MKVWNYCIISVAMAFILQLAGVPITQSVLGLIGVDLASQSIGNSSLYIGLIAVLIAATAGGIVIGYFTKSNTENILLVGFITGSIVLFGSTFWGLLNAVGAYDAWIKYILWGIFIPLGTGFVIAIAEFFRGTD